MCVNEIKFFEISICFNQLSLYSQFTKTEYKC